MIVGVLKEIKAEENRVCMTPAGVEIMRQNGHTVLVEKNAGMGSGFNNKAYETAGAEIVDEGVSHEAEVGHLEPEQPHVVGEEIGFSNGVEAGREDPLARRGRVRAGVDGGGRTEAGQSQNTGAQG